MTLLSCESPGKTLCVSRGMNYRWRMEPARENSDESLYETFRPLKSSWRPGGGHLWPPENCWSTITMCGRRWADREFNPLNAPPGSNPHHHLSVTRRARRREVGAGRRTPRWGEYPAIGPVGVNDSDEDSSLSAAHLRIFEQMCSSDLNIPPDFSQLIATRCERRKPMIY